jgi:hypothetical protein
VEQQFCAMLEMIKIYMFIFVLNVATRQCICTKHLQPYGEQKELGTGGHMIDREKLIELIAECKDKYPCRGSQDYREFKEYLADFLVSKGVTIHVRCWECKHHGQYTITGNIYCKHQNGLTDPKAYDFCSYGERKEDV